MHVAAMNVPNKDMGTQRTDGDLRNCLERFMNPENTNLGMITELIPVKMRWVNNDETDMSKLCVGCKIHSKDIMDRKRVVANRSGSSIIGDIVEKFLQSMTKNQSPTIPQWRTQLRSPKFLKQIPRRQSLITMFGFA